jgi:hypothetical protein
MPADDLVLNVRQVAGYPPITSAPLNGWLLMQLGLGGPYQSISPQALVSTALATGGNMAIAGALAVQSVSGGSAQFSNGTFNVLSAQKACIVDFAATYGSIGGVPIATMNDLAAQYAASVNSFNGRRGDVRLWIDDIICAGGAPIFSPRFQGSPRACTPPPDSNSSRVATTAFVAAAVGSITGDFAPIDSPAFTGVPTAPTPAQGSSDGTLATTAFVMNAVADSTTGVVSFNGRSGLVVLTAADLTGAGGALLASPLFTGAPAAPTAAPGTSTTQLATTAFVQAAVSGATGGVSSFNGRTGAVTLGSTDISAAGGALVASSVASFNGRTGAVNLIANDISGASGALLASPAFTGAPTAPTPAPGDSSTRIATTAFVASMTGFAPINSPTFTGVPAGPTAAVGTSTTQLATTAFVTSEIASSTAGVASFNSRTGVVTLLANDISSAGGALLASPALTGTPTATTAAPGTGTTQIATCAFVAAAIAAAASTTAPLMNGTAAAGSSALFSRGDHVHPVDTSRYAASNPSGFQTAAQVTASLANYLPLAGGTLTGLLTATNVTLGGAAALSVGGGAAFGVAIAGASNFSIFATATARYLQWTGGGWQDEWIVASGTRAWLTPTITAMGLDAGGNLSITGTLSQASDARLKRNVAEADQGLAIVKRLTPKTFWRIHDRHEGMTPPVEREELGFIAQDVEAELPWAVVENPLNQTLGIDLTAIVAALVNAVKELATRVAELEAA